MSIGPDLKETYTDVGTSYLVLRGSGEVELGPEYGNITYNRQVTKPFVREFFREASFPYDTVAVAGDVVRLEATDEVFLVSNKTPRLFENQIISHETVLYKCNVSGELKRPSGEIWDSNYQIHPSWQSIRKNCYALQTEALYGHSLETDEEIALIGMQNHELYLPAHLGALVMDRYEPVSGEYYMAKTKKTRRYDRVDVLEIIQDNR